MTVIERSIVSSVSCVDSVLSGGTVAVALSVPPPASVIAATAATLAEMAATRPIFKRVFMTLLT